MNDPEVVGTGSGTQDYGMRIYNPALCRFLSVDPVSKAYPELTPYQFASNRPIDGIDLEGLEWSKATNLNTGEIIYTVKIKVVNSSKTLTAAQMQTHMTNISASLSSAVKSANANTKVNVVYEIGDKINKNDFVLEFVDKPEDFGLGQTGEEGVKNTNPTQVNHMQVNVGLKEYEGKEVNDELIAQTGAHEIVHTTGIPDVMGFPGTFNQDGKYISNPVVQSMKDSHGGKNLMWNIPDASLLVKEQVGLFDKYLPADKQTTFYSTDAAKKDNTAAPTITIVPIKSQ